MPICQVVSAQTLKKQNQMLKDSIGIMHKVIDEKSSINSALSKDNSTLKNQNVLLKASKDSLIKEQKTLLWINIKIYQYDDGIFIRKD